MEPIQVNKFSFLDETLTGTELTQRSSLGEYKYKNHWVRAMRKIKIIKIFLSLSNKDQNIFDELRGSLIILPYSIGYLLWIIILFLSMIYLSTVCLYKLTFSIVESRDELIIDCIIQGMFLVDIIVSFNLAYFDEFNYLIFSRSKISLHYLKTFFIFDIVSVFPLGLVFDSVPKENLYLIFAYRHLPKIFKWVKLTHVINRISYINKIDYLVVLLRPYFYTIELIIFLFCTLHIISCFFYLCARVEGFSHDSWISESKLTDVPVSFQYITCLYWALVTFMTIGYGDIHPCTSEEMITAMIWMISSVFIMKIAIGKLSYISGYHDNEVIIETSYLYSIDRFAQTANISSDLATKIKRAIAHKISTYHSKNFEHLITIINADLRYQAAMDMFNKGIMKFSYFSNKKMAFLATFPFWLEYHKYDPLDHIYYRGTSPDGIYFVMNELVKICYENTLFHLYNEGEYFGDIEFFSNIRRYFDTVSCSILITLKLPKNKLLDFKKCFRDEYREMKRLKESRFNSLVHGLAEMNCLKRYLSDYLSIISEDIIKFEQNRLKLEILMGGSYDDLKRRIKEGMRNLNKTSKKIERCEEVINDFLFIQDIKDILDFE